MSDSSIYLFKHFQSPPVSGFSRQGTLESSAVSFSSGIFLARRGLKRKAPALQQLLHLTESHQKPVISCFRSKLIFAASDSWHLKPPGAKPGHYKNLGQRSDLELKCPLLQKSRGLGRHHTVGEYIPILSGRRAVPMHVLSLKFLFQAHIESGGVLGPFCLYFWFLTWTQGSRQGLGLMKALQPITWVCWTTSSLSEEDPGRPVSSMQTFQCLRIAQCLCQWTLSGAGRLRTADQLLLLFALHMWAYLTVAFISRLQPTFPVPHSGTLHSIGLPQGN